MEYKSNIKIKEESEELSRKYRNIGKKLH